jgi:hypothetical protein
VTREEPSYCGECFSVLVCPLDGNSPSLVVSL